MIVFIQLLFSSYVQLYLFRTLKLFPSLVFSLFSLGDTFFS